MKYKIVVTDVKHRDFLAEEKVCQSFDAELVVKDCQNEDELIELVKDADGVLNNLAPLTAKVINSMTKCKCIARYGVGYDNVDIEAANKANIWVSNVPDYCDEDVSDQAIALMLSCVRDTVYRTNKIKEGKWLIGEDHQVFRIKGKVFGFIGFGRIGMTLHRKLQGFNLDKFLVYDPYLSKEKAAEVGVELVDLTTLLTTSDFISLHAPLTDETRNIIGAEQLALMKKEVIIINTSRGPLIDEAELINALKNGKIKAAGLDVFVNEPVQKDNALFNLDNVVLSDHHGWYSEESFVELKSKAALNIKEAILNGRPVYPVNKINE
jgi:D-3-phosphoglycerate dehydrogenase / 2-oxoglutarate reductase